MKLFIGRGRQIAARALKNENCLLLQTGNRDPAQAILVVLALVDCFPLRSRSREDDLLHPTISEYAIYPLDCVAFEYNAL